MSGETEEGQDMWLKTEGMRNARLDNHLDVTLFILVMNPHSQIF